MNLTPPPLSPAVNPAAPRAAFPVASSPALAPVSRPYVPARLFAEQQDHEAARHREGGECQPPRRPEKLGSVDRLEDANGQYGQDVGGQGEPWPGRPTLEPGIDGAQARPPAVPAGREPVPPALEVFGHGGPRKGRTDAKVFPNGIDAHVPGREFSESNNDLFHGFHTSFLRLEEAGCGAEISATGTFIHLLAATFGGSTARGEYKPLQARGQRAPASPNPALPRRARSPLRRRMPSGCGGATRRGNVFIGKTVKAFCRPGFPLRRCGGELPEIRISVPPRARALRARRLGLCDVRQIRRCKRGGPGVPSGYEARSGQGLLGAHRFRQWLRAPHMFPSLSAIELEDFDDDRPYS